MRPLNYKLVQFPYNLSLASRTYFPGARKGPCTWHHFDQDELTCKQKKV